MSKQQIVIIHGGETFDSNEEYRASLATKTISLERLRSSKDWKDALPEALGDSYDVLAPRMPNASNAQYDEWALWFSRILPLLNDNLMLIGHSLGGIFLVRYLGENDIDRTISKTILIAPPFNDTPEESLASFHLPDDPTEMLQQFATQAGEVHLFHSTDDPVVPYADALQYKKVLPSATIHTFEDRKHFNIEDFPELLAVLHS